MVSTGDTTRRTVGREPQGLVEMRMGFFGAAEPNTCGGELGRQVS